MYAPKILQIIDPGSRLNMEKLTRQVRLNFPLNPVISFDIKGESVTVDAPPSLGYTANVISEIDFLSVIKRFEQEAHFICRTQSLISVLEPSLILGVQSEQEKMECCVIDDNQVDLMTSYAGLNSSITNLSCTSETWQMRLPATGIILAGGKSSRMGRDKGLLPLDDCPMIQKTAETLLPWFDEVLISSSNPDKYKFLGLPLIQDRVQGRGPLEGIYSTIRAARNDRCFVVACDIPEIDVFFARTLLRKIQGHDVAIPIGSRGHLEPVFAAYSKSSLPAMERCLETGERRIRRFFPAVDVLKVPLNDDGDWLKDLNSQEDYLKYTADSKRRKGGKTEGSGGALES
jgi:molybdenum cofactor guanylyltransferase